MSNHSSTAGSRGGIDYKERNRCNGYYPFRDYPRYLPERGCRNYYDDNGYRGFDYNYGRGQNYYSYPRHHYKRCR